MMCLFEFGAVVNGRRRAVCRECGTTLTIPSESGYNIQRECKPGPDVGPGAELKKLFDALGIHPTASCHCAARRAEMNRRGVQGCIDTKPEIIEWLKEAYGEAGIAAKIRAGLNSLRGYPKTLAGLLDLAIANASSHAQRPPIPVKDGR